MGKEVLVKNAPAAGSAPVAEWSDNTALFDRVAAISALSGIVHGYQRFSVEQIGKIWQTFRVDAGPELNDAQREQGLALLRACSPELVKGLDAAQWFVSTQEEILKGGEIPSMHDRTIRGKEIVNANLLVDRKELLFHAALGSTLMKLFSNHYPEVDSELVQHAMKELLHAPEIDRKLTGQFFEDILAVATAPGQPEHIPGLSNSLVNAWRELEKLRAQKESEACRQKVQSFMSDSDDFRPAARISSISSVLGFYAEAEVTRRIRNAGYVIRAVSATDFEGLPLEGTTRGGLVGKTSPREIDVIAQHGDQIYFIEIKSTLTAFLKHNQQGDTNQVYSLQRIANANNAHAAVAINELHEFHTPMYKKVSDILRECARRHNGNHPAVWGHSMTPLIIESLFSTPNKPR